ncbi:MAG: alpha/beta hydrolase [Ignavibacteriae bacterium]|nr:alpha/beta hydrolase [Ignavibacteriota bacterium]MCB0750176.1 alpha/beta hydrolase [Ignavibacteriota bacterium]
MKKYFTLFICLQISAINLFSQNYKLPLWEKNIPNENDVKVEETIEITDKLRITAVDEPIIEVYLPSKNYATGEAIVICPGGGYRILAYNSEGSDVAKWLNSRGIAGIVVKYRLPITPNNIQGRLSPFLDLQRAIRLTRFKSHEWGIDPSKVGVMGFSAGGHLASTLGTHFEDNFFSTDKIDSINCRPDFMVLMYPVITLKEPFLHLGSRTNLIGDPADSTLINYYSNELHITENTPPTFLVHADDDKGVAVENSLMFYNNLRKHGVKCEMHIFQEGGHGFGLAVGKGRLEQWKDLCITWIKNLSKKL